MLPRTAFWLVVGTLIALMFAACTTDTSPGSPASGPTRPVAARDVADVRCTLWTRASLADQPTTAANWQLRSEGDRRAVMFRSLAVVGVLTVQGRTVRFDISSTTGDVVTTRTLGWPIGASPPNLFGGFQQGFTGSVAVEGNGLVGPEIQYICRTVPAPSPSPIGSMQRGKVAPEDVRCPVSYRSSPREGWHVGRTLVVHAPKGMGDPLRSDAFGFRDVKVSVLLEDDGYEGVGFSVTGGSGEGVGTTAGAQWLGGYPPHEGFPGTGFTGLIMVHSSRTEAEVRTSCSSFL